jgi:hypothetical protein
MATKKSPVLICIIGILLAQSTPARRKNHLDDKGA